MGASLGFASLAVTLATATAWVVGLRAARLSGRRGLAMLGFAVALGLGVVALLSSPGTLGGIAATFGTAAGAIFLGLQTLAGQVDATPAVAVGGPILDFTAPDDQGKPFDTASLRGKPYLLKFFRGHW
ncbi:MAG: hypothetical protein QNK05_01155 [Myxococcota bacterium]|nr:hypothetical protein [Myxococcota bacterium]